jgi:hypothetical protein
MVVVISSLNPIPSLLAEDYRHPFESSSPHPHSVGQPAAIILILINRKL